MISTPAYLLLTLVIIAYILYKILKRRCYASLPPGPAPIPLLGNMHSLIGRTRPNYEIITELSKTHGDIMTFWIFNKPVIVLSSSRAVKEVYADNKEVSDRPTTNLSTLTGLFGFDDYTLKMHVIRNAFVQSIRSFWNSPTAEKEIVNVVEDVTQAIISAGREGNNPILLNEYIIPLIYNITMLLEFDKKFALDDPVFLRLICEVERVTHYVLRGVQIFDTVQFLQNLFRLDRLLARFKRTSEEMNSVKSYFMRLYEDINAQARKDDEIESIAHDLIKRFKDTDTRDNFDGPAIEQRMQIGDEDIINTLCSMLFGATTSTSTSLNWLLLEMVLHPEIQEKCYQELMEVTNGRPVTQSDRNRLPYIEACIMESLRHHPVPSFGVPHVSHSDITIRNCRIPAGVVVVMNMWGMEHDESVVKDAHHFNPDNFLDDEGQFLRNQNLFPFGAGRRMCPGEVQAKLSLFFAFTTMLGRVRFERVEKCQYDTVPDPSKLPLFQSKKYYVNIKDRKPRSGNAYQNGSL